MQRAASGQTPDFDLLSYMRSNLIPFDSNRCQFVGYSNSYFQLFNVKGSSATKIAVSPDFRKFATLDDAGIVYNLVDMSLVQ